MGELWVPQFQRVNLGGPDGDPYADELNLKLCWHRWEGTNWSAAESSYTPYPPHIAAKFPEQPRQYVPLDQHSYSLLSSESEREFVIQIELAGFSHESRYMSQEEKDWIAEIVLVPILFFFPQLPDAWPQFYDDMDGITLASPNSPARFSSAQWKSFSGHVAHQTAPAPDDHWDAGRLDLPYIVPKARSILNPIHEETYDMADLTGPVSDFTKDGHYHVIVLGTDNCIYEKEHNGVSWLPWLPIAANKDKWRKANEVRVTVRPDRIDIVGTGIDGMVYHYFKTVGGTWVGEALGGAEHVDS